jgi:tRNA(Ile2) C34 agmatinyltransferase TiaS
VISGFDTDECFVLGAISRGPTRGADRHEKAMIETHTGTPMSGRAGSKCPECGGQLQSENGITYRCRDCGREFDSADVFLL